MRVDLAFQRLQPYLRVFSLQLFRLGFSLPGYEVNIQAGKKGIDKNRSQHIQTYIPPEGPEFGVGRIASGQRAVNESDKAREKPIGAKKYQDDLHYISQPYGFESFEHKVVQLDDTINDQGNTAQACSGKYQFTKDSGQLEIAVDIGKENRI
jgi:hypothetical protein